MSAVIQFVTVLLCPLLATCASIKSGQPISAFVGYRSVPNTVSLLTTRISPRAGAEISALWDSAQAKGREAAACLYGHLAPINPASVSNDIRRVLRPPYWGLVIDSIVPARVDHASDTSVTYEFEGEGEPGCPWLEGYIGRVHTHITNRLHPDGPNPIPSPSDIIGFDRAPFAVLVLVVSGYAQANDGATGLRLAWALRNVGAHGSWLWGIQ